MLFDSWVVDGWGGFCFICFYGEDEEEGGNFIEL